MGGRSLSFMPASTTKIMNSAIRSRRSADWHQRFGEATVDMMAAQPAHAATVPERQRPDRHPGRFEEAVAMTLRNCQTMTLVDNRSNGKEETWSCFGALFRAIRPQ